MIRYMPPPIFTPAERADICLRFTAGEAVNAIRKTYGRNYKTVLKVLKDDGAYERGRKFQGRHSDAEKRAMAARYAAGETQLAIAKSYDTIVGNVRSILLTQGVELRARAVQVDASLDDDIRELRAAHLSIPQVAERLCVPVNKVRKRCEALGISAKVSRRGDKSTLWRGGKIRREKSPYVWVWVRRDDPYRGMCSKQGYIAEHRLVMARSLGRLLTDHETVHHINGDASDNRLENLQLRKGKHGKGVVYACLDCGSHNVAPVPLAE